MTNGATSSAIQLKQLAWNSTREPAAAHDSHALAMLFLTIEPYQVQSAAGLSNCQKSAVGVQNSHPLSHNSVADNAVH